MVVMALRVMTSLLQHLHIIFCTSSTRTNRLWYSSPDLSPFLLDSDLGRFDSQVQFQFSLCTFAVLFCLGRMTFCQHTTKDFRRYLLNTYGEINTFLFLFYWYILQLRTWTWTWNSWTWTCTRSHVVLADLDLKLEDLDLKLEDLGLDCDFAVAGLDTSLQTNHVISTG